MADIYYGNSVKAICADGVTRATTPRRYTFDGSMAADTFFSVPAFVRVNGRTVRGFIRGREYGETFPEEYVFTAYAYRKNADAIAT